MFGLDNSLCLFDFDFMLFLASIFHLPLYGTLYTKTSYISYYGHFMYAYLSRNMYFLRNQDCAFNRL